MNIVEPFRDPDDIAYIKNRLLENHLYRDYCLFVVGINIGLRISDLSRLKWSDVLKPTGKFKDHVDIYEKKTGKFKRFKLNDSAKEALSIWLENIPISPKPEYIFYTRSNKEGFMNRKTAERILKREAGYVGVANIGTHSLRKTFGYHLNKAGVPISVIMKMFNHSSEMITMRYLGIAQDEMDQAMDGLNL